MLKKQASASFSEQTQHKGRYLPKAARHFDIILAPTDHRSERYIVYMHTQYTASTFAHTNTVNVKLMGNVESGRC